MKANEAPEKIYLYPSDRAGEEYENEWGAFPWGEGSVEYVRTDAFIEKAVEWIEEINNHHSIMRYSDSCEPPLSELTEWFRNYMKGE